MAEEGARSRDNGGEPGMEGAHTGPSGRDPMGAPDPGEYASGAEVEYDDDIDRDDVDEADFDDEYDEVEPDDDKVDEDGGGGSVLGLLSYLWMFIALVLFAYLITTVQNQAGIIKVLKRRVATMESRLGLQPLSMDL